MSPVAFARPPPEDLDTLEAEISKSRKKQPKLLYRVWDAARQRDQSAFADTLLQAVLHFEKTMRVPQIPEDAIAFYPSVLLAVARHLGMHLPDYEPRILARLVSHESLGLPLPIGT